MTNNEHNEKVLAQISVKLRDIEDLKATLKPADAIAEVSLEQCNAGAREAHFAKYAEQEKLKQAVNAALASASTQAEPAEQTEVAEEVAEEESVVESDVAEEEVKPKKATKKAAKDE